MVSINLKCFELHENCKKIVQKVFSVVSSIIINLKILIVSGTTIRGIFKNSVTYTLVEHRWLKHTTPRYSYKVVSVLGLALIHLWL